MDRETRRSAPKTLLNSVHGENLEDLQHHPAEELDCQRSARQSQKNCVQGENQKDLHQFQYHPQLECQRTREDWTTNGLHPSWIRRHCPNTCSPLVVRTTLSHISNRLLVVPNPLEDDHDTLPFAWKNATLLSCLPIKQSCWPFAFVFVAT